MTDLVPLPDRGRRYSTERKVRLGDTNIAGRLRLDALARFLQDVANDDARDALAEDASSWVVRRAVVDVHQWPGFGEVVALTTFCGGTGGRWAERRTTVAGGRGGSIECAAVWVHIDFASGRPSPLPERFMPIYGEVYGTRKVSGRLTLPGVTAGAVRSPWQLRASDFDVMGHVNNAAYWIAVEEVLDREVGAPVRFELEYKLAIEPDACVDLASDGGLVWLTRSGTDDVYAAARITPLQSARERV